MTSARLSQVQRHLVWVCVFLAFIQCRTVAAQTPERDTVGRGRLVSAAVLVARAPLPTDGYFDDAVLRPLGVMLSGGIVTGRWFGIGGEVVWQHATTSVFEHWHGHTEVEDIHGSYTVRQIPISFVAHAHFRPAPKVRVEPVGGLTFCLEQRSLTNRAGIRRYIGGTLPVTRPDIAASSTRKGVVFGGDAVLGPQHVNAVIGVRMYRLTGEYVPFGPSVRNVSFQLHIGIRWTS